MTVIGLTGGIASGKSTAAEVLRDLGAVIIDADRLGHRSYEPGTPGFQKVVNAFGHDIVAKDGTIDRRVLGGKVFGAPGQLERLNSIVWPEIRALIIDEVKQIRSQDKDAIIVLEAAVLLEAKWQDLCDEVWVVVTPVETAVERMKSRNGLSEEAAMSRINAQMSNKERIDASDVKIENASSEAELHNRVERAWNALLRRLGRKVAPASTNRQKAVKTGTVKRASASAKTSGKTATKPAARAAAKPSAASTTAKTKAAAKPAAKAAAPKTTQAAAKSAAKPAASKATKAAAKPAPKATAAKAAPAKAAPAKAAPTKTAGKPAAKPAARATASTKAAPARATSRAKSSTASAAKKPSTGTRSTVRGEGRAK
jgi:dephospho-CoA kinase